MSFADNYNKTALVFNSALQAASFLNANIQKRITSTATALQAKELANRFASLQNSQHEIIQSDTNSLIATNNVPYRPKEWDDKKEAVYAKTDVGGYFFDAVLKAEHSSSLKITEHPVQNGANITDHAIKLPERLVLEIGMSDCMDTIIAGQFTSHKSKSISAYQTLKKLQSDKLPITVTTRLQVYENMLIEHISAPDDFKTLTSLKCSITFKEIIIAEVNTVLVSSRPQATGKGKAITPQPQPVNETVASKLEGVAFGEPVKLPMLKGH